METTSSESPDEWDQRVNAGGIVVRRLWSELKPSTKALFTTPDANGEFHYDASGRRLKAFDKLGQIGCIEYSLGVLSDALKAKLPRKQDDEIPGILLADEVVKQARELLLTSRGIDPEFSAVAIQATVKYLTAGAFYRVVYVNNDSIEGPKRVGLRLAGGLLGTIVFGLGLPFSIGEGLAFALRGDGFSASLCLLFATFAIGFFMKSKDESPNLDILAYKKWLSIADQEFPIGTGQGLSFKIRDLMQHGVSVPSVLIDLCAMLHSRWQQD